MFFASDWVIEKKGINDIEHLYDAAADLNCIIWYRRFSTPEGLGGARFILIPPSEAIFHEFLREIDHLVFKNWYLIDLSDLPQDQLPTDDFKPMRMSEWSENNRTGFMKGFYEVVALNDDVRKRKKE